MQKLSVITVASVREFPIFVPSSPALSGRKGKISHGGHGGHGGFQRILEFILGCSMDYREARLKKGIKGLIDNLQKLSVITVASVREFPIFVPIFAEP